MLDANQRTPVHKKINATNKPRSHSGSVRSNAIHHEIFANSVRYPITKQPKANLTAGGVMLNTPKPRSTTAGPKSSTTCQLAMKCHIELFRSAGLTVE